MKKCIKCLRVLPPSEFYKHKQMADGHLNKCKECCRTDAKENRVKRLDYYREYDRNRGNRQEPEYMRELREKYPKQYKAQNMLNNAIRDGRMVKRDRCDKCGSGDSIHAHHDDYDHPLDVRWLCAACHRQWHIEHGEAKNRV